MFDVVFVFFLFLIAVTCVMNYMPRKRRREDESEDVEDDVIPPPPLFDDEERLASRDTYVVIPPPEGTEGSKINVGVYYEEAL
ncbi:unnamed protein product [Plutella xylostella]|uniref:(diamondback moth) hypothetical protein n=1 Tax=Plutella xylostella TaxID=51655 RepID=A0A8S4ETZ4_PLUXY|nr:unnamed protein product [Plutella xylostella]